MKKVIGIQALYKNAVPGGFCVLWNAPEGFPVGMLASLERYMGSHSPGNGEAVQTLAKHRLGVLDALADVRRYRLLTEGEQLVAICNLYWLEQRGHITADEFNGMQFVFAEECIMNGRSASLVTSGPKLTDCGIDGFRAINHPIDGQHRVDAFRLFHRLGGHGARLNRRSRAAK